MFVQIKLRNFRLVLCRLSLISKTEYISQLSLKCIEWKQSLWRFWFHAVKSSLSSYQPQLESGPSSRGLARPEAFWLPPCHSSLYTEPLVAHPSLAWCLERKIPVGRPPFSQAGRRRSDFSGDEEHSPPPDPVQGSVRSCTHLHQYHKPGNGAIPVVAPSAFFLSHWD